MYCSNGLEGELVEIAGFICAIRYLIMSPKASITSSPRVKIVDVRYKLMLPLFIGILNEKKTCTKSYLLCII